MSQKLKTEADRKASPAVPTPTGVVYTEGKGQRVSRARGSHTNNKKNPGKRAHKGGS